MTSFTTYKSSSDKQSLKFHSKQSENKTQYTEHSNESLDFQKQKQPRDMSSESSSGLLRTPDDASNEREPAMQLSDECPNQE